LLDFDPDLGVFTSVQVRDGAPILTVLHDRTGDWQFLSNREMTGSDALFVHVGHLADNDPTVRKIADLPIGWRASRAAPDGDWTREPIRNEDEHITD